MMSDARPETLSTPRLHRREAAPLQAAGRRTAPISLILLAASLGVLTVAAGASAEGPQSAPPDVAAPPSDAERTASGLASKVLTPGTGDRHPDGNDRVAVHFTGWTTQGDKFQSSYDKGQAAVFDLRTVFPGWAEAMQLMVKGEKRRIWIPEHLGPKGPKTGPDGATVFEIEMLDIQHVPDPAPPADAERTPSGAFTTRLAAGSGDEHPQAEAAVLLNYTGWTTDGTIFASSSQRGRPAAFPLARVMAPFAEAVRMMVVGEKRQVWIPEELAAGNWPGSPEGMLIFELELLEILPQEMLNLPVAPQSD